MINMSILSWGTALPAPAIAQTETARLAVKINGLTTEQARLLPALYRRTGVRSRSSVLLSPEHGGTAEGEPSQSFFHPPVDINDYGPTTEERMKVFAQSALPLALEASAKALRQASLDPDKITHLVTVSCSGFQAPGVDIGLIRGLNLSPTTERIHIGFMGCHGALNGLRAASALAAAHPKARILLCAVELCSLHYQYGWDPEQVVANALFADGAAAAVGMSTPYDPAGAWQVSATGSCLLPDCEDAMTWKIGNHGFKMTLSPRVPDLIRQHLRPWLEGWLATQNLDLDQVKSWAIHPGGPRILNGVETALGLPPQACATSREVLSECGNMSSPTILFILQRLAYRHAPRPCVALGFGPGLTAEAVLFI